MFILLMGWCLGVHTQPLIDESVEAWRAGPVIRPLYNVIKQDGSSGITERLPVRCFRVAVLRDRRNHSSHLR
ncbi:type II toxin-antitoxin system antitoxin SocA domain-containing protein [Xylella fastidiosa]|uniref:type II toxin-antitoxin system antitoxin SocA domain-containing protein n=1 Tax=Xylella fastidiosa TaxID=2371 RepID=UPI00234CB393|nr:type II toxin-antitoxin system antitoxin SocA domain-containing protein [Xylella fastidiosa]MDC6419124.1 DUF4065 domain-containing protein [Xylella fastidiosa subsp. multiplex]